MPWESKFGKSTRFTLILNPSFSKLVIVPAVPYFVKNIRHWTKLQDTYHHLRPTDPNTQEKYTEVKYWHFFCLKLQKLNSKTISNVKTLPEKEKVGTDMDSRWN